MSKVTLPVVMATALVAVAGCGTSDPADSPIEQPGPLGIPGWGWLLIIIIGITSLERAIRAFGRRDVEDDD